MHHEFTIGHLFAGVGGGALGAAQARVSLGSHSASFRTLGGVDNDAPGCADFEQLVQAPCLEADVHELTPEQLRSAWGDRAPDMVLLSPPCKGFSALLSAKNAKAEKYQRLNRLVLEGIFLLCSTWEEPPAVIFLENVPRITHRGRELLAKARQLLRAHGYVVTGDAYHDCGELGGLAQHRRRFFLVARRPRRIPQFIYEPGKLRIRACGEVLAPLPMPGDEGAGGPLHRLPRISWLNWIRLALIPAGGDWRDLPGVVPDGRQRREVHRRHAVTAWEDPARAIVGPGGAGAENVADPRIALSDRPNRHRNKYAVGSWSDPAGCVTGSTRPGSGAPSIADPRIVEAIALGRTAEGADAFQGRPGYMSVADWESPTRTVTGKASVSGSSGVGAVADPRYHRGVYGVRPWDEPLGTVCGESRPSNGAFSVADPRTFGHVMRVTPWGAPAGTVTSSPAPSSGGGAVADPRLGCAPRAGAYGVLSWEEAAATITGSLAVDNGRAAVADPRLPAPAPLPEGIPSDPRKPPDFIPVIVAADGTWHRPLTTLELAALQGFPTTIAGRPLELVGRSQSAWRERIGNAIPPPAAQAIASEMLLALLAAKLGTFRLSSTPIWVKDQEIASL